MEESSEEERLLKKDKGYKEAKEVRRERQEEETEEAEGKGGGEEGKTTLGSAAVLTGSVAVP